MTLFLQVRICAQDLRERFTMTRTTLGNAFVTLEELQSSGVNLLKAVCAHFNLHISCPLTMDV